MKMTDLVVLGCVAFMAYWFRPRPKLIPIPVKETSPFLDRITRQYSWPN